LGSTGGSSLRVLLAFPLAQPGYGKYWKEFSPAVALVFIVACTISGKAGQSSAYKQLFLV
jgi:hypothetical protein